MPVVNSNTKRKHRDAINEYHRLTAITKSIAGKEIKLYTTEYCLAKAAHKFYMSPSTLEDAMYRR